MSKIAVITDSSCDYSPERAKAAGFSTVPLTVTFEDGSVYRDGIDLTSAEFFEKLKECKELPKSSQPTLDCWMEEFQKYADYDDIIVITISSGLSGTIGGATMARRMLREEGFKPNVHIVDSMSASGGIACFALEAVRMRDEGKSAQEILLRLNYLQNHLGLYVIFDSMEYLRKGGRIGNATMIAGKLMGIKPLLTIKEGKICNCDKVRGMQAGYKKLIDGFLKNAVDLHRVVLVSSCTRDCIDTMRKMLQTHISDIEITEVEVGPVIGTYAGPGAIALVYEQKEPCW